MVVVEGSLEVYYWVEYTEIKTIQKFQNFRGLGPKNRSLGFWAQILPKHVFSLISTKNNAMIVVEGSFEVY